MPSTLKAAAAAVLALSCAAALPACAQAPTAPAAKCEFKKLGDMPVDMSQGVPRVQVDANSQTRWLLIDPAYPFSSMRKADLLALGGVISDTKLRLVKSNGDQRLRHARLKEVLLGKAIRMDAWDVMEGEQGQDRAGAVGVIGADLLAGPDVEFDLAHNRIAFFTATDCGNASLAYWDGPIDQTPLFAGSTATLFTHFIRPVISLDGHPAFAQLDAQSSASGVDIDFADMLKIKAGDPGVTAVNGYPQKMMTAKFASFAMGGEKISNPTLTIWKFPNPTLNRVGSDPRIVASERPLMVLGLDFLRSHRVLIATSQLKMYFSYNGGPVFTTFRSK